jgi:endonuclease III related protein
MNMSVLVLEPDAAPSAHGVVSLSARSAVADAPRDLSPARLLTEIHSAMAAALGPIGWWPARTSFEVIVGAILTQNTAWTNVERALVNLRREKLLTPRAIEAAPAARLAPLIRSSGYFRQKAKKLKAFVSFLRSSYGGSLVRMFAAPTAALRKELLAVQGIGPETADSILLYAGQHTVFVVDAYARRILSRHGLVDERAAYGEMQSIFQRHLPANAQLFNEYHALIVNVGKRWCHASRALCTVCPLGSFLPAPSLVPQISVGAVT